jgi:hypothetical protein
VQVDLDQSQIVIESTAIEKISFSTGNITADALYAGLATFSTESETVTNSSIDVSEDYPCVLDIDIVAVTSTTSTITATVKNVAAPFDIHADLTALTDDPEMYDVFPDYSSPDIISATSWALPNQNTLQWTNITHPAYTGGDVVIISLWVCNTENKLQFFTERVFNRKNVNAWY